MSDRLCPLAPWGQGHKHLIYYTTGKLHAHAERGINQHTCGTVPFKWWRKTQERGSDKEGSGCRVWCGRGLSRWCNGQQTLHGEKNVMGKWVYVWVNRVQSYCTEEICKNITFNTSPIIVRWDKVDRKYYRCTQIQTVDVEFSKL